MFSKTKKIFTSLAVVSVLLLSVSCKKETSIGGGNPPPPPPPPPAPEKAMRLTAIYVNDTLKHKYYYGSNKMLSRYEYWSNGAVYQTNNYSYDTKGNPDKRVSVGPYPGSSEYRVNTNGQIISSTQFNGGGDFTYKSSYIYDASDKMKLIRTGHTDAVGYEYAYNEWAHTGFLPSEKKGFTDAAPGVYKLSYRVVYSHTPGTDWSKKVRDMQFAMLQTEITEDLFFVAGDRMDYIFYNAAGLITSSSYYTAVEKQYGAKGELLMQKIKRIPVSPAGPTTAETLRYEYTEL